MLSKIPSLENVNRSAKSRAKKENLAVVAAAETLKTWTVRRTKEKIHPESH
jgi:hypothetical protein